MEKSLNMHDLDNIPNIDDDEVVSTDDTVYENSVEVKRKTNEWGDIENQNDSYPNQNDENDDTPDEQEEKARLISQVLELQNTLDGNIIKR